MTTNCLSVSHPPVPVGRLFTLRNERDMAVTISERGAAIVSWWAPDRYGRLADVLLAQTEGEPGLEPDADAALAGRGWQRRPLQGALRSEISGGLDPRSPTAVWQGEMQGQCVSLRLLSCIDQGVDAAIRYQLDDDGRLTIEYEARAELPVTIKLGSNPRFNLNGGRGDVGDHMLRIAADYYFKLDQGGVAVGIAAVGGTPFDFREPAAIGPRLRWPDAQIRMAGGFDHCYCFNGPTGAAGPLRAVAHVYDPGSGRQLQVSTTEAGLRFYSGGTAAAPLGGFCLEASADPERSPDEVCLRPGQVYRQTTVYQLSLQG